MITVNARRFVNIKLLSTDHRQKVSSAERKCFICTISMRNAYIRWQNALCSQIALAVQKKVEEATIGIDKVAL